MRRLVFEEAGRPLGGRGSSARSAARRSRRTGGLWAGRERASARRLLLMPLHPQSKTLVTSKRAAAEEAPPPPAPAERVVFVLASLLPHNLFEASLLSQTLELDQWIKLVQN